MLAGTFGFVDTVKADNLARADVEKTLKSWRAPSKSRTVLPGPARYLSRQQKQRRQPIEHAEQPVQLRFQKLQAINREPIQREPVEASQAQHCLVVGMLLRQNVPHPGKAEARSLLLSFA